MKRIKQMIVLSVVLCSAIVLSACSSSGLRITDTVSERIIPEGNYAERTISDVLFYVPSDWVYDVMLNVPMYRSEYTGSSINVITQNGAVSFKNEKKSDYQSLYNSLYSNVTIATFTLVNFHGDTMLYISLTISEQGQTLNMWQLLVSKNSKTYIVTITTSDNDIDIAEEIYLSLLFN